MCLYFQFDSSWFEVHVVGFLSKYFNAFKAYILLLLMFYIILTRVGCGCGLYMLPTFHFNLTYSDKSLLSARTTKLWRGYRVCPVRMYVSTYVRSYVHPL